MRAEAEAPVALFLALQASAGVWGWERGKAAPCAVVAKTCVCFLQPFHKGAQESLREPDFVIEDSKVSFTELQLVFFFCEGTVALFEGGMMTFSNKAQGAPHCSAFFVVTEPDGAKSCVLGRSGAAPRPHRARGRTLLSAHGAHGAALRPRIPHVSLCPAGMGMEQRCPRNTPRAGE